MATSYNSPTPQERWHQFSAAAVRAFHRYATWLVKLSWWRFGWYALLLIIVTGLIQKLPPFSMTYYETIVDSVEHRKPKAPKAPPAAPSAPAAPAAVQLGNPERPEKAEQPEKAEKPEAAAPTDKSPKTVDIQLPGIIVNTKDHTVKNKGVNITFTGDGIHISDDDSAAPAATAASEAAQAASAAKTAVTAKDRAEAARYDAAAKRDAALAQAITAKAAAEQAHAQALVGASAGAASAAAQAASAAASAANEAAVDMVVGGQHIRIAVPAHATAEDVRDGHRRGEVVHRRPAEGRRGCQARRRAGSRGQRQGSRRIGQGEEARQRR